MPKYRVHFSAPVVYQPDHLVARRDVVDLDVWAETPTQALQHAIRVTQGEGLADPPVEIPDA